MTTDDFILTEEDAREFEYQRRLSCREHWRRVLRGEHGPVPEAKRPLYEEFANREINRDDIVVTMTPEGPRFS